MSPAATEVGCPRSKVGWGGQWAAGGDEAAPGPPGLSLWAWPAPSTRPVGFVYHEKYFLKKELIRPISQNEHTSHQTHRTEFSEDREFYVALIKPDHIPWGPGRSALNCREAGKAE